MLRRLRSLLRVLKSRSEFEHGMAEELRSHIEHYAQDLIRSGCFCVSERSGTPEKHIIFAANTSNSVFIARCGRSPR
jgi:hypothetical protein